MAQTTKDTKKKNTTPKHSGFEAMPVGCVLPSGKDAPKKDKKTK